MISGRKWLFGLKNDARSLRVWRTSAEADDLRYFQPTFNNSLSVMFWGCIGPNAVGWLVFCKDSLNATKYIAFLQNNFLQLMEAMFGDDGRPFIFQQDNAPTHRAKITNDFLREASINVVPRPAQSTDLNIIKNVWLYIKNKMNRDPVHPPNTKDQLVSQILR